MSAGATAVYAAPEMLLKLRGRFEDRPDRGENSSDSTRDMSDSGRVVAGNFDELSKLDVFAYAIVCAAVFSKGRPVPFLCYECPFASSARSGHRGCCARSGVEAPGPRRPAGRTAAAHGAVLGDAAG